MMQRKHKIKIMLNYQMPSKHTAERIS